MMDPFILLLASLALPLLLAWAILFPVLLRRKFDREVRRLRRKDRR